MDTKNIIVMRDAPEAATFRTDLSGWVSRHGRFYGDDSSAEDMARYDGCTHVGCKNCGKPCQKSYTACDVCSKRLDQKRFDARPKKEWDGVSMLYSESKEIFYSSPEEAEDDLAEDQTLHSLNLRICEPERARIDVDDFEDILIEDEDAPDYLLNAINAFNATMKANPPLSWSPCKYALLLDSSPRMPNNDWDDLDSYGPSALKPETEEKTAKTTENMSEVKEKKLRHLLFIGHGNEEHFLYGDDGERCCNTCHIDFNHDTVDEIEQKTENYNIRKIARLKAEGKWPPDCLKSLK
jgi:hypothetical protein